MDAPAGEWRLIREEERPGAMQMALDEVAAETAAAGGPSTVRTYRWDPSCLTMGYGQDPDTVDWRFCEREGIDVTRRQTGGGGIYHDHTGDIAYSIAVPADDVPGKLIDCYHLLCTPILDALDRLGVDARFVDEEVAELYHPACYLRALHPAHDMVAGPDGRKIAGNAQYRRNDAVIQHGSVSFTVDAERHLGVFADPPVTPAEFRERVTGIDEEVAEGGPIDEEGAGGGGDGDSAEFNRADAVAAFEDALAEWSGATEGSWTDAELARAEAIVAEKYETEAWVRTRPGSRNDGN